MYRVQTWSRDVRFWLGRAAERAVGRALGRPPSALDGARALPNPLGRSVLLGELAADIGFDWESAPDALAKVSEEVEEVAQALEEGSRAEILDELGDLLFATCMVARKAGLDPERALAGANDKFTRRFQSIEGVMRERGVAGGDLGLEELEDIWAEVKRRERAS